MSQAVEETPQPVSEPVSDGNDGPSGLGGSEPAKIIRIGSMIRALLSEVRHAPLDEAGRDRMRDIYHLSIAELSDALPEQLAEELDRLTAPLDAEVPSEAELRLAQAQLVGWLEGLFHGIQAAVSAQQAMATQQLREMQGRQIGNRGTPAGPAVEVAGDGAYL